MVDRLIYFLFLTSFFSLSVSAVGVGITPDKVIFRTHDVDFYIFNSNDAAVAYTIAGCERNNISMIRSGMIDSDAKKQISLRLDKLNDDSYLDCDLDISISNSLFAIGFSIPVIFEIQPVVEDTMDLVKERSGLTGKAVSDLTQAGASNYIWLIVLGIGLILALIIIWKFL